MLQEVNIRQNQSYCWIVIESFALKWQEYLFAEINIIPNCYLYNTEISEMLYTKGSLAFWG